MYVLIRNNKAPNRYDLTAYYPLANEVAMGCSNATVHPSITSL